MAKCLSKKKKKEGQMGPKRLHLKWLCFLGQANVYMWTYCIIFCVCVCARVWMISLIGLAEVKFKIRQISNGPNKKRWLPIYFYSYKEIESEPNKKSMDLNFSSLSETQHIFAQERCYVYNNFITFLQQIMGG